LRGYPLLAKALEFYQYRNRIYVEYAGVHHTLKKFMELPEAADIVARMYDHIISDYIANVKYEVTDLSNKAEVLSFFITKHFLKHDNTFDVVYLEGGNKMKFNLEN
jgi:hypothetical protein